MNFKDIIEAEWREAEKLWELAVRRFQQAGVQYQAAGAAYLNAVGGALDRAALANAQAEWQQANIDWQRAGVEFQSAGADYKASGLRYIEKSSSIYNDKGNYTILNPTSVPVVVVNNGSLVRISDLMPPFDIIAPSGQGPGKFAYNWVYWDRVYGYAYFIIDENGYGYIVFEFTNGEGYENDDDSYSAVSITAQDGNGKNIALFGIATYIGGNSSYFGIGNSDNHIAIGGPKNHGHAHRVEISKPADWWKSNIISLKFEWKVEKTIAAAEGWLASNYSNFPEDSIFIAK